MTKFQRFLLGIGTAAVLMTLADLLLIYLELPQWVRLPMMAFLGWMLGVEIGNWLNKHWD